MKLGAKYGSSKLEKACEQILKYAKEPSIRILTAVLKGNHSLKEATHRFGNGDGHHGITRGAAYFSRKEDDDDE